MRFIQAWQMYNRIPMKSKSILPDEGFEPRRVILCDETGDGWNVYCKPKPGTGYAKHRVMVVCDCHRHIPFGRMGQHYRKCKATTEDVAITT